MLSCIESRFMPSHEYRDIQSIITFVKERCPLLQMENKIFQLEENSQSQTKLLFLVQQ